MRVERMRIAIISFSVDGAALAKRIAAITEQGHEITGYITRRHAGETSFEPFDSVYDLAGFLFDSADALIFISACGIAVRAIAPLVKSKLADPAVVVCDETGRFAISLISGHAGGANLLTQQVAAIIGATPVITTASDSHIALDGTEQPQNLVLGIGCRRGLSAEAIERAVTIMLWDQKISLIRVRDIATIDIKRDEEGLLGFAGAHKIPLRFYSAEELAGVRGGFSSSDRVLQTVGVDNVCERAAALCGGEGKFIMRKTTRDGVAVAVFEKERGQDGICCGV